MRTLDSILICEGETEKKFQIKIAIDSAYPMQAAYDSLIPVAVVPAYEPALNQQTGWFFHVNKKNVLISQVKILDQAGENSDDSASSESKVEKVEDSPTFFGEL